MSKYKNYVVVITFFLFIIAFSAYAYRGMTVSGISHSRPVNFLFLLIPLLYIVIFSGIFIFKPKNISPEGFKKVMLFFAAFLAFIIPVFFFDVFVLLSDLTLFSTWIAGHSETGVMVSKIIIIAGSLVFVFLFLAVLMGIFRGRFNFKVKKYNLSFPNLPASFNGLKIVQVSDFHIGSFIGNMKQVQRGVDLVNRENPDIIFFTGDLITIHADEVIPFIPILKQFKARLGKYSILGNHSYSGHDYFHWNKVDSPEANLGKIIDHHKTIGFDILLNESRQINLNGDSISVLGIENWGYLPFPQAGDLDKAMEGVEQESFKILLSHDPSFWEAKVIDGYPVELTLSGHTHGMQIGIKIGKYEWSPASFKYPRWGGLYQENGKFLNVNRGFGHVIYSARIGMPPEITVIELNSADI
jgi:predicted MPP superfamily phosphohydrolase